MPQYTALILIYFHKDTEEIKAKKNLSYIDLAKLAGYPEKRIGRLATILRFSVQIKQNKQLCQVKYYPEEYFIKDLESAYNKTHRLDFLLLLKLYKLSGLNPNEFAKNIISRKCRKNNYYLAHPLINLIKKYSLSTVSYEKIRDKFQLLHDQHRISDSQLKKAFALINLADNVKSIPLIHNSVKYSFRFNEANLYQINDYGLKEKIAEHFTKIKKGNYPQEIFNDRWITRASILYLSGTNKERLLTDTIKNLIKQLNSVRLIGKVKTGFIYTFTEEARKIHDRYGKKYGTRPNHPPILNNMIRKNHIMGIEVPLWAQTQGGEYVTGHIDLLAYYKNKVIIGDYKPTEREIFRSLPQICVYAYMLRERLQLKDFENIICVSYSKDVAWAFKPQILEGILKFIEKENSRRTENLKCKRCWKGLPLKDLAQEIAKIIM
jgi:transcriptional regulator with XRE-family HTH domain